MRSSNSVFASGFGKFRDVLLLCGMILCLSSVSWATTVHLNALTSPSSGVSGQGSVNVTGSGFPSGAILPANVTVSLATSCGGAAVASTPASSVIHVLGTVDRVHFLIPSGMSTGTYFVSISDTVNGFNSGSSCSKLQVTGVSAGLNACVPTSSLGVNAPVKAGQVLAYVPLGAWDNGTTGMKIVQVEQGGAPLMSPVSIPTTTAVNSCAANPSTGEAVCTENNSNVDIINGTTLSTTLTSAANTFASFSGGSCFNCGVAMDSLNNRAAIAMGLSTSPSGSAIQFLDLGTNTFAAPISLVNQVSEDILVDPTRALILSPNESSVYDVLQTTKAGAGTEFANSVSPFMTMDSAAEDCSTGIALTVGEFSNNVYLGDLTQAVFTAGSPAGTWSAPQTVTNLGALDPSVFFSAGASGVSVAQGSSHLAIVTGEFGGSSYAVLQLPSTSGSGTPGIVDFAFVSSIPGFSAGLDPHTVTAYTSGNSGKAIALMAGNDATILAQVDMACVLALPRTADGHTVSGGVATSCTTIIGPF